MKNKGITNITKIILITCNVSIFFLVWSTDYNNKAFFMDKTYGLITSLLIYCGLYLWFCRIYRAFSIASNRVAETVFSQLIAFGISDVILYLMCDIIRRRVEDYHFMLLAFFTQVAATSLIIIFAKQTLMKKIIPANTLLIYGESVKENIICEFVEKLLSKYSYLFQITETIQTDKVSEDIIIRYDEVILYGVNGENRNKIAMFCISNNKIFYFVPEMEDIILRSCEVKNYMDTTILRYNYGYSRKDAKIAKRCIDIVFSLIGLAIAAVPMIIISIFIWLEDKGPVFFTQERITENGKAFRILKFRSMVVDADKYGVTPTTVRDPRITRTGKFIRKTRLDELPQLINILKGDMTFVGPRPERTEHVLQYEKEYPAFAYRKRIKAGLTGYAQVYGKYNTSAEDKLKLDLFYIENQSMLLDLKIMLLTLKILFQGEGTEGFSEEKSQYIRENSSGSN